MDNAGKYRAGSREAAGGWSRKVHRGAARGKDGAGLTVVVKRRG